MNIKRNLLICVFSFLISGYVFGQGINGIATYQSKSNFLDTSKMENAEMEKAGMDKAMQLKVMAMIAKQSEKEFTLEFNQSESVYKEVKAMEQQGDDNMEIQIVISGPSSSSGVVYKNLKEGVFMNQTDVFGKLFLVKDSIQNGNWVMSSETKKIGEYTCFKATFIEKNPMADSVHSEVVAWYTPQIPVKNGPGMYGGLPGLILELSNPESTILCSRIVLNPQKKIKIKVPSEGKIVSSAEYDEIYKKKMKEMVPEKESEFFRMETH